MASQGAPRNGAKERFWRRLFQQWRRSGMTIRDFCAEHDVSEPSFFAWRRTIAERDRQHGRSKSCPGDGGEKTHAPTFVPLRVVSPPAGSPGAAGTALEVVLPSGGIVRVPAGFDPATLRQLLDVLERDRSC
ncbi:MAG: IS66 family insertion sequence element accessory protein TnpA [Acidimicrobiia bacterium]